MISWKLQKLASPKDIRLLRKDRWCHDTINILLVSLFLDLFLYGISTMKCRVFSLPLPGITVGWLVIIFFILCYFMYHAYFSVHIVQYHSVTILYLRIRGLLYSINNNFLCIWIRTFWLIFIFFLFWLNHRITWRNIQALYICTLRYEINI